MNTPRLNNQRSHFNQEDYEQPVLTERRYKVSTRMQRSMQTNL